MVLNEVIEENSFVGQLNKLKKQYPKIYDVKYAVTWVLSRNPISGLLLPNEPIYRIYETAPLTPDDPKFWVLYRYDQKNEKVYLLSMVPVPEQDEEK